MFSTMLFVVLFAILPVAAVILQRYLAEDLSDVRGPGVERDMAAGGDGQYC